MKYTICGLLLGVASITSGCSIYSSKCNPQKSVESTLKENHISQMNEIYDQQKKILKTSNLSDSQYQKLEDLINKKRSNSLEEIHQPQHIDSKQ